MISTRFLRLSQESWGSSHNDQLSNVSNDMPDISNKIGKNDKWSWVISASYQHIDCTINYKIAEDLRIE